MTGHVVITGGSAGVGRAAACAFAAEGWRVTLLAREPGRLDAAAAEAESQGGEALVIPSDVADAERVEAAAVKAEETFGPIDVWVNSAMATVYSPLSDITAEEFRRVTEVTYLGQVYGSLSALRRMRPRNRGTIVNVSSALAYHGLPLQAAYCGAKFACRGFTQSVRAELLAEGAIETAMGERIEQRFEVRGGVATFVLESERPVGGIPVATRGGRWDLTLSGRVPMALTVDTGVGQATLDLSELALTRLGLDTGVGASTVTLPARGEYEVDIDTGIGAATVLLPEGLAVRLTVSRGIGSISVPDGLVRNEDVYESPDYRTASDRVDIRLDSGLGAVNVERVR